jgi:urease accessory protein
VEGDHMNGASPLRLRAHPRHARRRAELQIGRRAPRCNRHGPDLGRTDAFSDQRRGMVPVVALALLAGLRGAPYERRAMLALPGAWLLGRLLGLPAAVVSVSMLWTPFWFLLRGGLAVADAKLSLRSMTILSALFGVGRGYLNGAGMGISAQSILAAVGLAAAVFMLVVLVGVLVVQLRAHWARVAVRVGGCRVAASGLLMLGWSLRGNWKLANEEMA